MRQNKVTHTLIYGWTRTDNVDNSLTNIHKFGGHFIGSSLKNTKAQEYRGGIGGEGGNNNIVQDVSQLMGPNLQGAATVTVNQPISKKR